MFVLALGHVGCGQVIEPEPDQVGPGRSPSFSISDGAHGGNTHFYFLPPMVSQPSFSGDFDGSLSPVVRITAAGEADIVLVPCVDHEDELYQVNWHAGDYELDPEKRYTVEVSLDGIRLGYADLDVATSGSELRDVVTGEYIPLKDGRTLPIKFRIEEGVLPISDVTPPVLEYLDFTPKSVDVTDGPASVTYTLRLRDDLSGLRTVGMWLYSPSRQQIVKCSLQLQPDLLFEGDCTAQIDQYAEAGEWRLDRYYVRDVVGNLTELNEVGLQNLGFPTRLTVTGG
jgi:hypothetical protein